MKLIICLVIGLLAGLLMFCGDMLLYYDSRDYVSNGSFGSIIEIMKNVSEKRLYAGGIIGPIAAFLYCIGYYHIICMVNQNVMIFAFVCFLCCCMGIIIGGAYHSHCAYLGLLGKLETEESVNVAIKYFTFINRISFLFQVIGLLGLFICVVMGWTKLPQIFAVITPGILYLLLPIIRKLPKGLHIVIYGGWSNFIFVIYYTIVLTYNVLH